MGICVFVMQDLLESPAQGGSSLLRGMGVPCSPSKLLSPPQGEDSEDALRVTQFVYYWQFGDVFMPR